MVLLTATSMPLPMSASRVIMANFTRGSRLDSAQRQGALSKEGFELMVTGDPGVTYEIQATTMLLAPPSQTQWTPLGIVSNAIGMATFLDRTSTNHSQRFYRAVVPRSGWPVTGSFQENLHADNLHQFDAPQAIWSVAVHVAAPVLRGNHGHHSGNGLLSSLSL